jgi:hypothetical protein
MVDEEKQNEPIQEQTSTATIIPPAEPPKKSNKKWWIIGGCGCLTLLILTGIAVAAIIIFGVKSIQAPVAPIKSQLAAINNRDLNKAYYDYTSKNFKTVISFNQFKAIIESNPQIFKSKDSSFTDVSIKNGFATVKGTITGQDGTVTKMTYTLVKENSQWKIFNFKAV